MFHYVVPLVSLCHIVSQSKLAFGFASVAQHLRFPSTVQPRSVAHGQIELLLRCPGQGDRWPAQHGHHEKLPSYCHEYWMKTYENSAWIMIDHWFDFAWPSVSQRFTWVHIVWPCLMVKTQHTNGAVGLTGLAHRPWESLRLAPTPLRT